MNGKQFTSSISRLVFNLKEMDWLVIFAVTFVATLILELAFKSSIISSGGIFLDDLFYFERSISELSFNQLNSAPGEQISTSGSDYTPNLRAYRFLASLFGDIGSLRLFHLIVFCIDAALLAIITRPLLKGRMLAIGVATFSFVTPFSHTMSIFANGSYFILYFFFFFTAVICFRNLDFSKQWSRFDWSMLALGTVLAVAGTRIVDSGILLLVPLYVYLCWQSKALTSKQGRQVAVVLGVGLILLAYLTITAIEHPYKNISGRLDYSIAAMVMRGFSIFSQMLQHYFEPMLFTGNILKAGNLVPIITFLSVTAGLILLSVGLHRRALFERIREERSLPTIGFFTLAFGASVAPYTAQSITHIWHYFPHMIFFVVLVFALVRVAFGKVATTALLLVVMALTIRSYATSLPAYQAAVERQEVIAEYVAENAEELNGATKIFVISENSESLTGVLEPIRLTSFFRHTLQNPYLGEVVRLNNLDEARQEFSPKFDDEIVFVFDIPEDIENLQLYSKMPPFEAPLCAQDVPTINWPAANVVDFDSYTWNPEQLPWVTETEQRFEADGTNARLLKTTLADGTLVRLTMKLTPANLSIEDLPYSTTFPPMPVKSARMNIYQRANGFHLTSPDVPSVVSELAPTGTTVSIIGVEGCYYNMLTDSGLWQPLSETSMNGYWTVGRGVDDRYWQGIVDWKLEVIPNTGKVEPDSG